MARKKKSDGLPPSNLGPCGKLDTVGNVRAEMARLYRLGVSGKAELSRVTSLVYVLREIRAAIETGMLEDLQARLAAISAQVGARHG